MDEKLFSTLIKNKKLCSENYLCESKKFVCVRFLFEKVSLLFGTVCESTSCEFNSDSLFFGRPRLRFCVSTSVVLDVG